MAHDDEAYKSRRDQSLPTSLHLTRYYILQFVNGLLLKVPGSGAEREKHGKRCLFYLIIPHSSFQYCRSRSVIAPRVGFESLVYVRVRTG